MDGEGAGNRGIVGVERHIEPGMLAEIVEHCRKVFGLAGHEAVAHAGCEHQIGERGDHLLAADADRDALALGEADVIAPFLVEIRKKLLFRLSFDVQAEDVARLDCLEVFAAFFGAEAEALEHGRKGSVARRNVGVDFDDVGFVFLCQHLRAVQKLRKCLAVI